MNSKIKSAALLAVLFVVAMCSSRVACAVPPTDPCSLLTPAQVSTALGVPIGPGDSPGTLHCEWFRLGDSTGDMRVELHIFGTKHKLTPIDQFNLVKKMTPLSNGITKTRVSGVGDDAVYVTGGGMPSDLTVKKGKYAFRVVIYGIPEAQIMAKEKTLALDVLGKL